MKEWKELFEQEEKKEYYQKLMQFLDEEYAHKTIYPPREDLFTCFEACSYQDVKVVMLGQDPYHRPQQAHGLCFSVRKEVKLPPSLKNMYKELKDELGLYIPNNGYLVPWAEQGVLLLNTALTVRAGEANSHSGMGWEIFTDNIIKHLNDRKEPVIFVLWGNNARKKKAFITNKQHFVLEGPHPSPLSASRGFFGCGHFKKINDILRNIGKKEINWQIENI